MACVVQSIRTQQSACLRSCVAFFSPSHSGGGLYVNSAQRFSIVSELREGRGVCMMPYPTYGPLPAVRRGDCLVRMSKRRAESGKDCG
jgi:hypothetical protein